MKYILLFSIICINTLCSDSAHQAYQQLHSIICAGAIRDFQNNKATFENHLRPEHITLAQQLCAQRLYTITDLQTKGSTDRIGMVVTDFIARYISEPNTVQFLTNEKRKTMRIANALKRILQSKQDQNVPDRYLEEQEFQWGLNQSQCSGPER